jgi:glycosyltransferase involved in cell wall biosynthesis
VSGRLTFSVCIFAYNEQEHILECIESISNAAPDIPVLINVIANGCTDLTVPIVRQYAESHPGTRLVVLDQGDKANAWNHYVHIVAPPTDLHVFVDGDVRIARNSLRELAVAAATETQARAFACVPQSGRSRRSFHRKIVSNRELAGNFYALRDGVIQAFRARQVRLPIGMFGEDGLVTMLVKCDLDPLSPLIEERVHPCENAAFGFDSLSWLNPKDWRTFRNRKMRYAVRRQQAHMLYPALFSEGIGAMPSHVVDLYRWSTQPMELEWHGLDTIFDAVAIRRIRRKIEQGEASKRSDEAGLYS